METPQETIDRIANKIKPFKKAGKPCSLKQLLKLAKKARETFPEEELGKPIYNVKIWFSTEIK